MGMPGRSCPVCRHAHRPGRPPYSRRRWTAGFREGARGGRGRGVAGPDRRVPGRRRGVGPRIEVGHEPQPRPGGSGRGHQPVARAPACPGHPAHGRGPACPGRGRRRGARCRRGLLAGNRHGRYRSAWPRGQSRLRQRGDGGSLPAPGCGAGQRRCRLRRRSADAGTAAGPAGGGAPGLGRRGDGDVGSVGGARSRSRTWWQRPAGCELVQPVRLRPVAGGAVLRRGRLCHSRRAAHPVPPAPCDDRRRAASRRCCSGRPDRRRLGGGPGGPHRN